ncbi:trypsin-1-like [Oppia nitens]|uniref:trypsin-1-like n=1 Tax=Oppia nitens TaxID=1686743 RepID=UPI0023DC91B1|nr:trypsin-1-like [Oppia nitens]
MGSIDENQLRREGRVIGGEDASIDDFPWQVSLQKFSINGIVPIPHYRHLCGASIINHDWLLTAAHCVDGLVNQILPMQLRAVIGTDLWRNALIQPSIQVLSISKIVVHENWDENVGKNDIALLRTSRPIIFSDRVNSICIPDSDLNVTDNVLVTGWGMTSDRSLLANFLPNRLKKLEIPIVDMSRCRKIYNFQSYQITDNMLCAGSFRNGHCIGAYMGDSGGPLITYVDGRAYQIGLVSFSLPCRTYAAPDVYTKVSKYYKWIETNID